MNMRGYKERKRALWPLVFLVVILLFPYRVEYSWGFFSTLSILDIALLISFPVVVVLAIARGSVAVADRRIFVVLAMPLVFAVISLAWSINISATVKSIVVYGAPVVALLLAADFGRNHSPSQLCLFFVVISCSLFLGSFFSYVPGSPLRPEWTMPESQLTDGGFLLSYHARLSHPFLGLSNSFATILAMLLPIILFIRETGFWRRSSWWTAAMLVGAIMASGSRGVILAVVTAYAAVLFRKLMVSGRIPGQGILLVVAALGITALFVLLSPDALRHLADRFSMANVTSRWDAYAAVFDVLHQTPWGVGSGVSLAECSAVALTSVHNAYLQHFLWFGWVGGFVLNIVLLALPALILLIPVRSKVARGAKRAVAMSVTVLLLINLTQASWEGSVLRVWIYFVIGLGLVIIKKADLPRIGDGS